MTPWNDVLERLTADSAGLNVAIFTNTPQFVERVTGSGVVTTMEDEVILGVTVATGRSVTSQLKLSPSPSEKDAPDLIPGLVVTMGTGDTSTVQGDYLESDEVTGITLSAGVPYYSTAQDIVITHPGYAQLEAVKTAHAQWYVTAARVAPNNKRAVLDLTRWEFPTFTGLPDKRLDDILEDLKKFDHAAQLFFAGRYNELWQLQESEGDSVAVVLSGTEVMPTSVTSTQDLNIEPVEVL